MLLSLSILTLSALLISLLLTPLFRQVAHRLRWLDLPEQQRKIHSRPTPRIGGIPVVVAYLAAFVIFLLAPLPSSPAVQQALPLVWKVAAASSLIFAAGLLDDIYGLSPWQKLAAQLAAAGIACSSGICIRSIAGHQMGVWWTVPVTLLWLVVCTNAFNLIDGADGLASGVGLFATLTTFTAALLHRDAALAAAMAPLAGALLGFLRYNFSPASIFLGDGGSYWIGFLLGCYSVTWSQKSATLVGMFAPLMALAIPLLDTGLAILRRFLRHQPIFLADRGHIHHRLLDRGLTPRRVVLLVYGASVLAACCSLLQSVVGSQFGGLVLVVFCGAAYAGIHYLGYQELSVAARLINPRSFRGVVEQQIRLCMCENMLKSASTIEGCWKAIQDAAGNLGFSSVELGIADRTFSRSFRPEADVRWEMRVPLSDESYVYLTHNCEDALDSVVVSFAHILRLTLSDKLLRIGPRAAVAGTEIRALAAVVHG